jgi:hypothetical protein
LTAGRDHLTGSTASIVIQGTLTADSRLQFWIRRTPSHGDDDMAADARLIEVVLTFALT